jgi:hypothetical protein
MGTSGKVTETAADHPRRGTLWRGVHVLLHNDGEVDALLNEVPRLSELGVNNLVVEINYDFCYDAHPELRGKDPIGKTRARALARVCRDHDIRLIPQFQCLGHQSWKAETFPLLIQYPQFDETPGQYPGNQGIYCRSWCPQHPAVNPIVYDLFDELLEAFEADALHVGMDEVFLIASEHCPRCKGQDPAALFARAVQDYHAHLVGRRGVEMLVWGDRLLDANTTGYGEWEAAANGTHHAIDAIPRDIVVCDWHYTLRDAYPSIQQFLQKGFRVWPGGWREVPAVEALIGCALRHVDPRMLGYLCTTWGAVRLSELSQWTPIQAALEKLS